MFVLAAVLDKQPDYDPWGRPGAGAPLLDAQGHVVADYNSRKVRTHVLQLQITYIVILHYFKLFYLCFYFLKLYRDSPR